VVIADVVLGTGSVEGPEASGSDSGVGSGIVVASPDGDVVASGGALVSGGVTPNEAPSPVPSEPHAATTRALVATTTRKLRFTLPLLSRRAKFSSSGA
jgi:hypothetical protein